MRDLPVRIGFLRLPNRYLSIIYWAGVATTPPGHNRLVENPKAKRSLFRYHNELKDLRTTVRQIAVEGKDPTRIAREIRKHPYIVKALEFARKKQRPKPKFENVQVAAAVLVPWLPERTAKPLLRELFGVKNIWRSVNRFKLTAPAIMEAAKWILESGYRATPVIERMRRSGNSMQRLRRLAHAEGFLQKLPAAGFRRPGANDQPLDWTVSQLQPALRAMVQQDPKLERILRGWEVRFDEKEGPRITELALSVIRGHNVNTAAKELHLPYKSVSFSTFLRKPILYGKLGDKEGNLWDAKINKAPLTKDQFDLLQRRIPPEGVSQLVGLLWDEDAWIAHSEGAELVEDIYYLHIELEMGYGAIAELTGLARGRVQKMFERTEYVAVVGEERFEDGRRASIRRNIQSSKQHGEELRKKILVTIKELKKERGIARRNEIAARAELEPTTVRFHLKLMDRDGWVLRLPGWASTYDITDKGKAYLASAASECKPLEVLP